MTKKLFMKKTILIGAISLSTVFSLAVVSCETKNTQPTNTPTTPATPSTPMRPNTPNTPSTTPSNPSTPTMPMQPNTPTNPSTPTMPMQPTTPNTTDSKMVVEKLNKVVDEVKVDVKRTDNTSIHEIFETDINFSNFDTELYKIKLSNIFKDAEKDSIRVDYLLIDISTDLESKMKQISFDGFSKGNPDRILDAVISKLMVDYRLTKKDIVVSDVKKEDITVSKFDNAAFKVEVLKINTSSNESETSVMADVEVTNIKTNHKRTVVIEIEGFKSIKKFKEEEKIAESVKDLEVDVLNKMQKEVSTIKISDVSLSNYDKDKYGISIEKIEADIEGFSLKVIVLISDKSDSTITLLKTFKITGFKNTGLTEKEFLELSEKIEFDYRNKENQYVWLSNTLREVTQRNVDNSIVRLMLLRVTPDKEKSELIVSYRLNDVKTSSSSKTFTKAIKGFKKSSEAEEEKKLHTMIGKGITFDVKDKNRINLSRTNPNTLNLIISEKAGFEVIIKKREVVMVDRENSVLKITYTVTKNPDSNRIESEELTKEISGFQKARRRINGRIDPFIIF